jgi:thiosulfate dehydrogenase [quinone] large subunit
MLDSVRERAARLNRVAQVYSPTDIPEPPLARRIFADTRTAWIWLIIRLYCGYVWLSAGMEKVFGFSITPGSFGPTGGSWIFTSTPGKAMSGFITGALKNAGGDHPSVTGWYAWFLQNIVLPHAVLFSWLIAWGELLVGLGLIVGALTGIAAFFGVFMNVNYLMSGTVSTNPELALLGMLLVLAWRVAGWYGLDRYLLPLLGTPWSSGALASKRVQTARPSAPPPQDAVAT